MTNINDPGKSFPIGATVYPDGVNFCVYSKNSTGMELLFFDDKNDAKPSNVIVLDPQHQSHLLILAHLRAWHSTGTGLRLSRTGTL